MFNRSLMTEAKDTGLALERLARIKKSQATSWSAAVLQPRHARRQIVFQARLQQPENVAHGARAQSPDDNKQCDDYA